MSNLERYQMVRKYIVTSSQFRDSRPDEVRSALQSIDALAKELEITTVWDELNSESALPSQTAH